MKILTLLLLLLTTTVGFSQTVLYGQEMSETYTDSRGEYSLALLEFNIKDSNIVNGDKVYHNNITIKDEKGYPYDFDYIIKEIEPHVYEIIEIK
jgi:hypothetical protein